MKKLILLELALLFLATTFQSDNPPGWYQQQLPVNDFINDIFFLDSLNGWIVTEGNYNDNDTSYILHTTNGGYNWEIQKKGRENLNRIQFISLTDGYALGDLNGTINMSIYKTTNSGIMWKPLNNLKGVVNNDLFFVNNNIGWICSDDLFEGVVFKTIDGGLSWQRLTGVGEFEYLFFLNKDTGWVSAHTTTQERLYRTINGGSNWELQFISAFRIGSIFFLNGSKGWIRGGPDFIGNGASYTTNGGFNWISSIGSVAGGYDIKFVNDTIGYSGGTFFKIPKSTDGGKTFGFQTNPNQSSLQTSFLRNDTLNGWMGSNGLIKTTDGGGTLVNINNLESQLPEIFILYQNYPNPFNPRTIINYELSNTSYIKLKVFDIGGKELVELVNEKQTQGQYKVSFDGSGLPSGVYFYRLEISNKENGIISETKKMILIR